MTEERATYETEGIDEGATGAKPLGQPARPGQDYTMYPATKVQDADGRQIGWAIAVEGQNVEFTYREPESAEPAGRPFDLLTLARFDQLNAQIRQMRDEINVMTQDVYAARPDPGNEPTAYLTADFVTTPTRRVRVNIAKTSNGYSHETTVEVTSHDDDTDLGAELETLLSTADTTARDEIDLRYRIDGGYTDARSEQIATA